MILKCFSVCECKSAAACLPMLLCLPRTRHAAQSEKIKCDQAWYYLDIRYSGRISTMQYVLFRYTTQAKHKSTSANISAIYVSVLLEPSPIVVAIIHPGVSAVTTSIPAPQITNILNAMLSQPRPGPATSTASTRRARLGPNTMEHNSNCFGALLLTAILK